MGSDDRKSSRQAEHWQKKYYDSLDELEQKEQQWAELEKILRLLVSRLTLVIETKNPQLDKQLTKLRSQIRESTDLLRLQPLMSEVTAGVAALAESAGQKSLQQNPAAALQLLLEQLALPRQLDRQVKHIRKKLERISTSAEVPAVAGDMVELINLLIEQKLQEQDIPSGETGKSGLLDKLFKSRETSEPETAPTTEQVSASSEPVAPESVVAEPAASDAIHNDFGLAADILIQLLERIDLPDELATESDLIRTKLEPCQDAETLRWGLDATAQLLADLRARIQREKKELEDFLLQLTQRLQELDTDIQHTARLRDASLIESREMNQAVNREVQHIQQSVSAALDLDTLKTSIQSRVIIIRNHVDRFLQAEEDRGGEAKQIIARLQQQLKSAEQETAALRQQVTQEQQKAMTDTLTGVPNRLAYDQKLQEELARFRRYGSDFVLMVWDVDKFKSINDTYGHAAGDKVLKIIATVLNNSVRETDFVARYGGEEFVVLLPETDLQAATGVAEKLRAAVENTEFHFRTRRVVITASCGLTQVTVNDTESDLFQRADDALYRAKQNGRNRYETG